MTEEKKKAVIMDFLEMASKEHMTAAEFRDVTELANYLLSQVSFTEALSDRTFLEDLVNQHC